MHANSHRHALKLFSTLLAASPLLVTGPAALRTIAQIDLLLARVTLHLFEIGLAVLRACGI